MKYTPLGLFGMIMLFFHGISAQTCRDVSVELSAAVQAVPPQLILNWSSNAGATQYQVYRKLKTDAAWGNVVSLLPGTATQFVDNTVSAGVNYEYRIIRLASSFTGYGYINTGIGIPVVEQRGKIILIVDSSFINSCALEIARLHNDMEGDGWKVIRHNVSRNAAVTSIKSLIVADYYQDPANTKAVFLLGHVPVPYSGNINPDGHPDHQGAWPADVYYGDIDGIWTDNTVNNTVASDPRNDNIPGDGKFDQSVIPSDVELQVGRVDLANMTAFSANETQLVKNYLDKDHNYRHKVFNPVHRAVVDDNFGYFSGEAFASSAWKNFGPLCGPANVAAADYFTSMTGNSYLWSYGCGGGSYTSASGIGNTTNFASSNLQGVFTMLFGSYFGDWDRQNNFLRAPLCQGTMLTNAWSGRPHWMFHHMVLGENIGYSARLTQNNSSLYYANYGARFVHVALMGDPTLRNDMVAPITAFTASASGPHCQLNWSASTDTVIGYYVYKKSGSNYIRLNPNPVTGTTFTDSCTHAPGVYTYMVRALRLQQGPSGSYYNLSQGISDTAARNTGFYVTASATYTASYSTVTFTNTSQNATSYYWDFGDGTGSTLQNPVHTFPPGNYTVTLIASNACDDDTAWIAVSGLQWNSLQGIVSYSNGMYTGLYNTSVQLKNAGGAVVASVPTDMFGYYEFTNITPGNYTLNPVTTIAPGGINSTDALQDLRHFVHMITLTGLYYEAGDVDNNNFINALDAMMISKKFTGQLNIFPAGNWLFEQPQVNITGGGIYFRNISGICIGDCNGSYVPVMK